jgi:hypothetical protein
MKKLVAIAVGLSVGFSAVAQGVLDFKNAVSLAARITESDTTTLLAGSAYKVDLFYGAVGANPSTFTSLGLAVDFNPAGATAGWFAGGTQAIPGFAAGSQVSVQPRAWRASDGATWALANAAGGHVSPATAAPVTVTLVSTTGTPPPTPPMLVGYVGHSLIVAPEPSTILLGLAGISGLLFLRRKMA